MGDEDQVRRTYDGSRRRAAADARRRAIVGGAAELFVAQGFGATSIDQIAKAADVSAPTVYSAFGSKAAVLSKAIDFALAGDFEELPLADRFIAALDAVDGDLPEQFAAAVALLRRVNESVAPLIRVMDLAASAEPALAELRSMLIGALRADCKVLVERFFADSLRPGLTIDDAADSMAIIISPATYSMFTVDAEWSPDRYQDWLAESLPRLMIQQ